MPRSGIKHAPVKLDDNVLLESMERLEEYLLAPMGGRTQAWAERVGWYLGELQEAVARHRAEAEADNGPFTPEELKGPMIPAMDARVEKLRKEHNQLHGQVRALHRQLQEIAQPFADSPKITDLLKLRRRGRQLLEDIRRHKENETILLMENVIMDIGAGD